jgi:hypothetical protein
MSSLATICFSAFFRSDFIRVDISVERRVVCD